MCRGGHRGNKGPYDVVLDEFSNLVGGQMSFYLLSLCTTCGLGLTPLNVSHLLVQRNCLFTVKVFLPVHYV